MAVVRSVRVSEVEASEAAIAAAAFAVGIAVAVSVAVIEAVPLEVATVADTGVVIVAVAFAAAAPEYIAAADIEAAHGPIPGAAIGADAPAHGAPMQAPRGAAIAVHRAG